MKDYIEIINENGMIEKMEVVSIFKLLGYDDNYLIYRDLGEKHYYAAKFKGEKIVDLDTKFSKNEINILNAILEGVM